MPDTETAPEAAADSPAATAAAPQAAPVATPSKFDAIVDAWFNDRIHGSALAQITPAYNAVFAALDDLKARLAKET